MNKGQVENTEEETTCLRTAWQFKNTFLKITQELGTDNNNS